MFKLISILLLSAVIFGGVVFPAFAQLETLTFANVKTILARLANWMFIVLLSVGVIIIIIAAFKYLTAGGDAAKVESAHKMLIYALVAIGIGILAKGFAFLVAELVGAPRLPGF